MNRHLLKALIFLCYPHVPVQSAPHSASGKTCQKTKAGRCEDSGMAGNRRLRWRALPYVAGQDSATYGGSNLEDVMEERFEGPVLDDDWDVLWTYRLQRKALLSMDLPARPARLLNHCGYFRGAGQKCILARHIARVLDARQRESLFGDRELGFLPTFPTHDDVSDWLRHVAADPDRYWIVKKCAAGGSQGLDLVLGHDVLDSSGEKWLGEWSVAQEYLERPFLGYGGRKFHLRLYILVTSWWPSISVLLYNDGLLFRSRHKYVHGTPSAERDLFSYIDDDVEGQPTHALWEALDSNQDLKSAHGDHAGSLSSVVRKRIESMFRTLFGHAISESFGDPSPLVTSGMTCFDLFGADVMLDEQLRPVLLEMNMSPNLDTDDKGPENLRLLKVVKEPLLRQISHWAALFVSASAANRTEAKMKEDVALLNFTRIL